MPEPASDDPQGLLEALTKGTRAKRLAAVRSLAAAPLPDVGSITALERAAVADEDPTVREAAMAALLSVQGRQGTAGRARQSPAESRAILQEVQRWLNEGLIPPELGQVLALRYSPPVPGPTPAAAAPAAPKHTLAQALLSEAAARVALYLGAFFILAAAFILAAIVEVARLPILAVLTVAFFSGAFALRRRLPQASFVLFAAGTLMIPILGGALRDRLPAGVDTSLWFWSLVTALMGLVWGAGTWTHRSRAFSVLGLICISLAAWLFGEWFRPADHLNFLLLEIIFFAGLGVTGLLRRPEAGLDGRPLFVALQMQQILTLGLSPMILAAHESRTLFVGGLWQAVLPATWLLASVFFAFSHRQSRFALFAVLAVAALVPVPPLLLETIQAPIVLTRWIYIVWGALLGYTGAALIDSRAALVRPFGPFLAAASILPLGPAAVASALDGGWRGVASLAVGAAIYLGLTAWRRWWTSWSASLVLLLSAYMMLFTRTVLGGWTSDPGWILLFPGLTLLGVEAVARRRAVNVRAWARPPGVLVWMVCTATAITAVAVMQDDAWQSTLVLTILGLGALGYAQVQRKTTVGFAGLASLALALPGVLTLAGIDIVTMAFAMLAIVYYGIGLVLRWRARPTFWAGVLTKGSLALGCLASLAALFEGETSSVVAAGITAGLFAVEGILRRDVQFAVPADLLFAEAYFLALMGLEVTEPQFYAIGVALLGIVTHYLFMRAGNKAAAVVAGILAQLILLTTTYLQMLSTERFLFFFILFFQALVLLVYGLVVRSRSFVLVPLPFSVLAVITVAFSLLSGLSTAVVIGCSGVLLLLMGILALLLRERLMVLTDRLGHSLGGWRG